MERKFDFSKLKSEEFEALTKELLERKFGMDLTKEFKLDTSSQPDFVEYPEGEVEDFRFKTAVKIFGLGSIETTGNEAIQTKAVEYRDSLNADQVIFVFFDSFTNETKGSQNIVNESWFRVLDLLWIEDALTEEPDIAEKWGLLAQDEAKELKVENLVNLGKAFHLVGHTWSGEEEPNKLDEFINDHKWINGHDDRFTDEVKEIAKGDVLFAKSSWARKSAGMLSIYAVGVVTQNDRNGNELGVSWHRFEDRVDMQEGAHYRRTYDKITDDFLVPILSNVLDAVPNLKEVIEGLDVDDQIARLIRFKLDEEAQFWWINAGDKWNIDDLEVGQSKSYSAKGAKGNYQKYAAALKKEDLLVGYQAKPTSAIVGLFALSQTIEEDDRYHFELLYKFRNRTSISSLKELPVFSSSSLARTLQGSLFSLEPDLFEEIINSTEIAIPAKEEPVSLDHKNPQVNNDGAYSSEDLLNIENDVRSFALLLATREVKPPIAVALFGKWGSGKSFFMRHLTKRINDLSKYQSFHTEGDKTEVSEGPFCKGIAQIEFNAWSYLDANLWAGMISSIFEKLDEFITQCSKGKQQELQIRKTLSEKLQVLSSEKKLIEERKEDLEKEKVQLSAQIDTLKSEKETLIQEAKNKELKDLKAEVLDQLKLEDGTVKLLGDYGITRDRLKDLSPGALFAEATSWYTFVRNLGSLSGPYLIGSLICVSVLLLVIIDPYTWVSTLLNTVTRQAILFFSVAGPVFVKFHSTYRKFRGVIRPLSDFKNEFNERLENAEFNFEKELEMVQTNLSIKESEIGEAQDQLSQLNKKIEYVEYSLDYFIPQKAFNNFIRKRIDEQHYEKHIGLISIIRRDFEVLSELFSDIKVDVDAPKEEQKKQEEKRKSHDKIAKLFKNERALERIILYIDDLDRCSDEKVLEVIQAVHLLMAFPLFNVVVGVDPRCVRNALLLKTQLEYLKIAPLEKIRDLGVEMITPSEYLEKIFQIPFELRDPDEKDVASLVGNLLEGQINYELEETPDATGDEGEQDKEGNGEANEEERGAEEPTKTLLLDGLMRKVNAANGTHLVSSRPENLSLAPSESERLKSMVFIVGSTPRTIKRYINIYRIIRAARRPESEGSLTADDQLAMMFLLAIGIGDHKEHASLLHHLIDSHPTRTVSGFLKDIEDLNRYESVILQKEDIRDLLQINGSFLKRHIGFVGRFSFSKEVSSDKEPEEAS